MPSNNSTLFKLSNISNLSNLFNPFLIHITISMFFLFHDDCKLRLEVTAPNTVPFKLSNISNISNYQTLPTLFTG
jgi:hypothetical protein